LFGILNIGYGAFNLLSLLFLRLIADAKIGPNSPLKAFQGDASQMHLLWVTGLISAVAGLFLMAAGVGLLLGQNWGRLTSLAWAVFDILTVLATVPLSWKAAHATTPAQFGDSLALIVTVFGLVASLAYPIALLIFMTRPKLIAALQRPSA
jgi:hypothetical protein